MTQASSCVCVVSSVQLARTVNLVWFCEILGYVPWQSFVSTEHRR